MVQTEILGPTLQGFAKDIQGIGRGSGELISASVEYDDPDQLDQLDPLTEADDMRRVDFVCHPSEPVKVLDDWRKPVHCLLCGEASG